LIQLHGGEIGCTSPPLNATTGSEFYYSISHDEAALVQWKVAASEIDTSDTASSKKGINSGKAGVSGKEFQQDVSTKVIATKTKNILVVDGKSIYM